MRFSVFSFLLTIVTFQSCMVVHKTKSAKPTQTARHLNEVQHRAFFDAESARLLGDHEKAIGLYKKFVEAYPQNATAHYVLARLQFMNRSMAEAEKNGKKACELAPNNIFFQEFYSQVLLHQNKLKEAEEQYVHLTKINPENPEYLYSRAMLELRSKHTTKALELLNEYELLTGSNADIRIQRKNIFTREGRYAEAIGEIKKMQQEDPYNVEYPLMLADTYEDMDLVDSVSYTYQFIEQHFENEPLALVALSQYYQQTKNRLKYQEALDKIVMNHNLSNDAKMAMLLPILHNSDDDSARALRDRVVASSQRLYAMEKGRKENILLLAEIQFSIQKNEEALALYKEYLQRDQTDLNAFIQVMSLSFDKNHFDSVLHYASLCILNHAKSSFPYFYKGITYSQTHQTDSSIYYLENTLKHSQKQEFIRAQALSVLGDAWNTKKEYAKSDSCFEEALKITPDDAGMLNNYAYFLSLRNLHLDRAEKMSKRSLELQPNTKSFLDTYGWILYQLKNYDEAKTYLQKAEQADGETDATIYEHIGDVYLKLNDQNKALYYWKQAKEKSEAPEELIKKINGLKLND